MRLPLLFILCATLLFLLGNCKKETPTETAQPEPIPIPYYNCRVKINGLWGEKGWYTQFTSPVKLIVTNEKSDTVYTDYYNSNKMDITFPLTIGTYMLNIVDTAEIYAPYRIKHRVYPPRGGDPNTYMIALSKFPKHKISIVSVTDTVIKNSLGFKDSGILVHLVTPNTTDTVYLFANYFKKPMSYPIQDPSILGGFYWYTINGSAKWFFPITEPTHEYINKGEVYYFSIVEASMMWYQTSRTEISRDTVFYNATGKGVQNFQFINY